MKTLLAAMSCFAFVSAASAQRMPNIPAMPTEAEAAALAAQGARPGDEAMTCEQVGAEMQPYVQPMMPTVAALGQSAEEAKAMGERNKAAAMAQAPMSIGAGIASSFLPGGGMIAQAAAAAQAAQMQKQAAEAAPLRDKMMSQSVDLANQMAPMQQDPRFQRLMQMAQDKKCGQ